MYEFHVYNIYTGARLIIFGYTANHAFLRSGIKNTELWEWEVESFEYVD